MNIAFYIKSFAQEGTAKIYAAALADFQSKFPDHFKSLSGFGVKPKGFTNKKLW